MASCRTLSNKAAGAVEHVALRRLILVRKSIHKYRQAIPTEPATGRIDGAKLLAGAAAADLSDAVLVLTAGTTSAGAIDDLAGYDAPHSCHRPAL